MNSRRYWFNQVTFDAESHTLRCGDKVVRPAPKASQVLEVLIEAAVDDPGRTMSREFLLGKVWGPTHVGPKNVDVVVSKLRKDLEECDPSPAADADAETPAGRPEQRHIEMVQGEGYKFVPPVERLPHERLVIAYRKPDIRNRNYYFDALSVVHHVTNRLLNLKSERIQTPVVKPVESPHYKAWIEEKCELKADFVLNLETMKRGETRHVSAQVLHADDRSLKCSGEFARPEEEFFNLLVEIVRWVVDCLVPGERPVSKRYTESGEAYIAYQTGRALWEQMRPESFRMAVGYFQKAAGLDPRYAKPLIGLADVLIWAAVYGHGRMRPAEAFEQAEGFAARALVSDGKLAGAHCSLAFVRLWGGQSEKAEELFRRALELNPFYSNAYQGYGLLLMVRREFERALETIGKAIETRPGRFLNYAILGIIYYEWGKDEEAVEALEECRELNPYFDAAYFGLALVHTKLGEYDKAAEYANKALQLSGFSTLNQSVLGYILAAAGDESGAWEIADRLSREYEQNYVSPYHLSVLFARLGDREKAAEWAETSERAKDPWRLVRAFDFRSRDLP